MVSVEEASQLILSHVVHPAKESIALSDATGRVLAEEIVADRDLPPFDRVTMDGVALSSRTFLKGRRDYRIVSLQAAGQPGVALDDPETCIEVMTGSILPKGADCVVRYEDLTITHGVANLLIDAVLEGIAVHRQGKDAKKGQKLLSPGTILSPAEIAVLASVGSARVTVFQFPRIAILSTGDELVPVDHDPLPHQIRSSNVFALQAALNEMQCTSTCFHVADEKDALKEMLREIMAEHDVLILSGGVSKGKFDFVHETLEGLGVQKVFHQVRQRPGKPFWFGFSDRHTVFALPGNPVSTFLCFYRYIKPWLLERMRAKVPVSAVILAEDYSFLPSLTYFLQVKIHNENGVLKAIPHTGEGSGDFANLRAADGFIELAEGGRLFKAGEVFSFIPFRYF